MGFRVMDVSESQGRKIRDRRELHMRMLFGVTLMAVLAGACVFHMYNSVARRFSEKEVAA